MWTGEGGGAKPTPQTEIFSHQCGGHLQPVGVEPPNPPTNRTLLACLLFSELQNKPRRPMAG